LEPQIHLKKNCARAIAALLPLTLLASCGERAAKTNLPPLQAPSVTEWQLGVNWEGAEIITPPRSGQQFWIRLTVLNPGPALWPDPQLANPVKLDGSWAVRVAHRFWDATGSTLVTDYSARHDLPGPVLAGQRIDLLISLMAPANPGPYLLQFDLLRESVGWFEAHNTPRFSIPLEVRP
jgi:hypothetical protein